MVLVIAFVFVFSVSQPSLNQKERLAFEQGAIQNFLDSCVEKTGHDGLRLLGIQGGRIKPRDYLQTPKGTVEYLLRQKSNKLPSLDEMKDELSQYIAANANSCFRDFAIFKEQGCSYLERTFCVIVDKSNA